MKSEVGIDIDTSKENGYHAVHCYHHRFMDVQFEGEFLKKFAKGKFKQVHSSLEKRKIELETAANLEEFTRTYPGARCHEWQGNQKGAFAVNLTGNYRLRFRPLEPFSNKDDGGINLKSVIAVVITDIVDPHRK